MMILPTGTAENTCGSINDYMLIHFKKIRYCSEAGRFACHMSSGVVKFILVQELT